MKSRHDMKAVLKPLVVMACCLVGGPLLALDATPVETLPAASKQEPAPPPVPPEQPTRVYRKVNPDGSVTFSDVAEEGGEAVDVRPAMTVPATPVPPRPSGPASKKEAGQPGYQACEWVSPRPDDTIGYDATSVTLTVRTVPDLQPGHTIQFFSNGQLLGQPVSAPTYTIASLERGSFTVAFVVRDETGRPVCESEAITYHVKRSSVLFPDGGADNEDDKDDKDDKENLPTDGAVSTGGARATGGAQASGGAASSGGASSSGGFGSAGGVGIPQRSAPK